MRKFTKQLGTKFKTFVKKKKDFYEIDLKQKITKPKA